MKVYDQVYFRDDGAIVVECAGGVFFGWDDLPFVRLYGQFLLNASIDGVDCIPLVDSKIVCAEKGFTLVYLCKYANITLKA